MPTVMFYVDNYYSDGEKVNEVLEEMEDVDEVVVLEGHRFYNKARKWAAHKSIKTSKYDDRPGLYGKYSRDVMFRNAIQGSKPDKIVSFGKRHFGLLSQAELNNIKVEIVR